MSKPKSHRNPLDFLSQIKGAKKGPPRPAAQESAGTAELNLDFSDLDSSHTKPAATPNASAVSKPGVAAISDPSPLERAKAALAGSHTEVTSPSSDVVPPAIHEQNNYINALFERVETLLAAAPEHHPDGYVPREPASLEATGLSSEEVEKLMLKFLLSRGNSSGRRIAQQICLPFNLVEPLLKQFKQDQILVYKGAATMGDYDYALTEIGRERARRYTEENTYFGACPVALKDYLVAMAAQSIAKQHATQADLEHAFSDIIVNRRMLDKLGPAVNSGRGMFLFGEAGNGKTTIAERITACFGSSIWIPRAIGIDGDIMRVYDPAVHIPVEDPTATDGLFNLSGIDPRWVQIRRPTVVVGGELTMAELEVKQNMSTKICEAPVQLKSNCGTLVIDDFGRQRMPVAELLNRWIVPLEKRYDYLNMPSGKKLQVPFDQIIIFSTNLEPKDLVDGAFLRRIPYKIHVEDPSVEEFHQLFQRMAPTQGFTYDAAAVEYLLETHYRAKKRPLRACQPRDLLLQVRNYCMYHNLPKVMTPQAFDYACENYFSVM